MDIDTRERSTSLSSWFMELGSQSNALFGMIGPSEDSPRKLPTETLTGNHDCHFVKLLAIFVRLLP